MSFTGAFTNTCPPSASMARFRACVRPPLPPLGRATPPSWYSGCHSRNGALSGSLGGGPLCAAIHTSGARTRSSVKYSFATSPYGRRMRGSCSIQSLPFPLDTTILPMSSGPGAELNRSATERANGVQSSRNFVYASP